MYVYLKQQKQTSLAKFYLYQLHIRRFILNLYISLRSKICGNDSKKQHPEDKRKKP